MGQILLFFLFLSYFYTFSFKNRLPSPAIGIIISNNTALDTLCLIEETHQRIIYRKNFTDM